LQLREMADWVKQDARRLAEHRGELIARQQSADRSRQRPAGRRGRRLRRVLNAARRGRGARAGGPLALQEEWSGSRKSPTWRSRQVRGGLAGEAHAAVDVAERRTV
jgi:hypothetical protein